MTQTGEYSMRKDLQFLLLLDLNRTITLRKGCILHQNSCFCVFCPEKRRVGVRVENQQQHGELWPKGQN